MQKISQETFSMWLNRNSIDPYEYLDTSREFGFFSFLLLKPGIPQHKQNEKMQFSYPLKELPELLPEFIEKANFERKNLYISQASFRKMNRQRACFLSIGCLFVDLDIYHADSRFSDMKKEQIKEIVHELCEVHCIPQPSIIIDSGGGMYLKWLIKETVFKHALSYWEVVQKQLNSLFACLGADANALDVSRVLRIVGSTNYKYTDTPLCRIMSVDYENLSATQIKKHSLGDFQPLMQYTLDEAQTFNERMTSINRKYHKKGATIIREKRNRHLILECLKELDNGKKLDGITPEKLNQYIKNTRQLKRFSLTDCAIYLPKFLKQKEVYARKFQHHSSTNNVIYSQNRFHLVSRNWGLYQDIIELAEYRYGNNGVPDGMRDAFMFTACAQYSLSKWKKSNVEDLLTTYRTIGRILVPHWTKNRIDNCLQALVKRLKLTKDGDFSLYRFSDKYLHNMLKVKDDELQIVGPDGKPLLKQMLGEDERNRRDPDRLQKKIQQGAERKNKSRRNNGVQLRNDYVYHAQTRENEVLRLTEKGLKQKQIAEEMGLSIDAVKSLKKRALRKKKA
ncbi:LuxR C-terminal-related transcriptional regulator [Vibrio alfacsensis]|uniref:LuxR C-terminal-related transcriptional regulator n=1 Tax=Vibrio alfacsensis TaxID=1074311 RepID=UPI004067A39A